MGRLARTSVLATFLAVGTLAGGLLPHASKADDFVSLTVQSAWPLISQPVGISAARDNPDPNKSAYTPLFS